MKIISTMFVTSNHQTTNLVIIKFFYEFFSVKRKETFQFHSSKTEKKNCFGPLKRKLCFLFQLLKLRKKNCFGPIKSLFSFSTAKTEKNSWKKLRKTRLAVTVVWCHEQNIHLSCSWDSSNQFWFLKPWIFHKIFCLFTTSFSKRYLYLMWKSLKNY